MNHWEEEDWLERELAQALERKHPSPDFAARVAALAAAPEPRVVPPAPRSRVFMLPRWIPAAAAVLVIVGSSGLAWRRHQGIVAKDQVMLAMRITAGKLNRIQTHVREAQQ
jgi:hypothetical protein